MKFAKRNNFLIIESTKNILFLEEDVKLFNKFNNLYNDERKFNAIYNNW
ncbi:MAG: hypothetical protein PHX09_02325 [Clostridia bacterium]|nr:hypothetical protein [Clostridia bacterium]